MPWQRLSCAGRIGPRARACGREPLLLIGCKPLIRKGKIPSRRFGPADADAMTRWEWCQQALGKIDVGDGNGAIVVGGRRIKGRPDQSDEGIGFGAQCVEKPRSRTGLHGRGAPNLSLEFFRSLALACAVLLIGTCSNRSWVAPNRRQKGLSICRPALYPSNRLFFGKPFGGRRPASARLPIHVVELGPRHGEGAAGRIAPASAPRRWRTPSRRRRRRPCSAGAACPCRAPSR